MRNFYKQFSKGEMVIPSFLELDIIIYLLYSLSHLHIDGIKHSPWGKAIKSPVLVTDVVDTNSR